MEGTIRLGDLRAGSNGSSPSGFVALDDAVYFSASDSEHGTELWRTDGSAAGTTLVRDIRPGTVGSLPDTLRAHEGRLLFRADDGVHGREPWTSDGSAGGTALLADIRPGPEPSLGQPGTIGAFRIVGNRLFFAADDGMRGSEPWASDGTPAGTQILADLNPFVGTLPSTPRELTPAGRAVFFTDLSRRLWHSDGTGTGTRLVGQYESSLYLLVAAGERLLFWSDTTSSAWVSDGTADGTLPLSALVPELESVYVEPVASLGGRALLFAYRDSGETGLWASDGTAAGTVFLVSGDIVAGWGVLDGVAYLSFSDGLTGFELWKTDGTPEGTALVRDIWPGSGDSYPQEFTASGGRMFFVAGDGTHGREVWTTDGSSEGTRLVRDLPPSTSSPRYLAAAGDAVYFSRFAGAGAYELWKTDGTDAGTVFLRTLDGSVDQLTGVADRLFFRVRRGSPADGEVELWTSEGTEAGTSALAAFPAPVGPDHLTAVEGRLLFSAGGMVGPLPGARQLFRSDGTASGTGPILDVAPEQFKRAGTRVFFAGDDGVHGQELWAGRAGVLAGRPDVALRDLIAETLALGPHPAVTNGLVAHLEGALRALDRHDRRLARRALAVFVQQLEALSGRRVPEDAARELVTFAEDIRELLSEDAGPERGDRPGPARRFGRAPG
jgi:ELWxxDGT repeat protein